MEGSTCPLLGKKRRKKKKKKSESVRHLESVRFTLLCLSGLTFASRQRFRRCFSAAHTVRLTYEAVWNALIEQHIILPVTPHQRIPRVVAKQFDHSERRCSRLHAAVGTPALQGQRGGTGTSTGGEPTTRHTHTHTHTHRGKRRARVRQMRLDTSLLSPSLRSLSLSLSLLSSVFLSPPDHM